MPEDSREPKFWTWDDGSETLSSTSPEGAVVDYVEEWCSWLSADGVELPEEIEVYGYAPMDPHQATPRAGYYVEDLIDRLDEELGDPNGDKGVEVTEAMLEAERAFVETIVKGYTPWMCEIVETRKIRLDSVYSAEEIEEILKEGAGNGGGDEAERL